MRDGAVSKDHRRNWGTKRVRLALLSLLGPALLGCGALEPSNVPWDPPAYFAPEQWAEVSGLRLCYLEAGQEHPETLVFVHGWSGNVHNWWDEFEHFSSRYHVLALDLPGHGKSQKGGGDSVQAWVLAVVGLMDERKIDRATIIGNSAGGNVAARIAIDHPDRVDGLVLADPTGSGRDGFVAWVKPVVTARRLEGVGLTTGEHFPGEDEKSRARSEMIRSYVQTEEEIPYLEGLAASFASSFEQLSESRLAQVRAPTLILWGEDDPVVPKRAARFFQKNLPAAEFMWVPGAGHNPNTETPEVFNCALAAFLEGRPTHACLPSD